MTSSRNRSGRGRAQKKSRSGRKQPTTEVVTTISSLGRHGHGIAETTEGRVYVPFALPQETARIRVAGDRGEIIEILQAADNRVDPACPHFGECGGCAVQHAQRDFYLKWKHEIVELALRYQGLEAEVEPIVDAHGAGRRRVTLHARRDGGQVLVGFMQAKSHKLKDIRSCPVLSPGLSGGINLTRRLAGQLLTSGQEMDVQLTETDAGIDCHVICGRVSGPLGYEQHMALADFADESDLARLTMDGDLLSERRKPKIGVGPATVTVPVGGFLQATDEGERVLSDLVIDQFTLANAHSVADLFCGIGSYALRAAGQASVFAADSSRASIDALVAAARHTPGLKPVEAVVRDLFENPVPTDELNAFDGIVFNPPRIGAPAQSVEIAQSTVPVVVAVSCDPSTFARDARVLVDGGYKLERVVAVDQFKWAAHVEVVGLFRRL